MAQLHEEGFAAHSAGGCSSHYCRRCEARRGAFAARFREAYWVPTTPTAFALETIASYTSCFVLRAQWRFNACGIEKTFIDEELSVTNRIIYLSLQATAGRSEASIKIMKRHPVQSALAPASGA